MRFTFVLSMLILGACGGSGSGSTPAVTPEVDFTATGLSQASVTVISGNQLKFVNKDTAAHQVSSAACPELNSPKLALNDSFSQTVSGAKACAFSDSLNPTATIYNGTVNIGPAGSDAGPGY